ncbi:MFS transporter [Caballeronia sp. SEWSISQ10-4 2]|uniref:MFS transporter n=1 Tax=Caballeronia sp. SEWSISQ10-4 2 TaxID=2937438 RepID=UPI00264AB67F|nr:MFS transporter [Caballeronia sp. SEWSISQ10-4 2]MDN7176716.1 MFS transporter [Caballeronia sp. SEWSISQ10-4 2]
MSSPHADLRSGNAEHVGHRATWALAIAQLVSWGSVYYGFSLFVVPMERAMGWSRTETNAALSLGLLVSGFAAYPIGIWIDHGHGRKIMMAGSILSTAMLLLWSQAHALATLFVVWIGLGVSMAATLYDPVFAVVTRDYPGSFRTKITLITLVAGFASTVFIPLTQGFVDWFGWRGALIALAATNIAISLPIHASAIKRNGVTGATAGDKARLKAVNMASTQRALRTPTFWALAVCFTAYYATFAALTFHLVPLMVARKVPAGWLLATMAIIGPAQVAARALWFAVGRNVRPALVGLTVTAAFPVSVLVLLYAGTSPYLLMLFGLVYGGANGMMTILRGTIVQDVMWTEGYGAISGLLSAPSNIAKGIAPISAAALWTIQRNYALVEWVILGVSLVSTAAFLVAMRFAPGQQSAVERAATGGMRK